MRDEEEEESWAEALHNAFEGADTTMPTATRVKVAMDALLRNDKATFYRPSPSA